MMRRRAALSRVFLFLGFLAAVPTAPVLGHAVGHWLHDAVEHEHSVASDHHVHEESRHGHGEPLDQVPTVLRRQTAGDCGHFAPSAAVNFTLAPESLSVVAVQSGFARSRPAIRARGPSSPRSPPAV